MRASPAATPVGTTCAAAAPGGMRGKRARRCGRSEQLLKSRYSWVRECVGTGVPVVSLLQHLYPRPHAVCRVCVGSVCGGGYLYVWRARYRQHHCMTRMGTTRLALTRSRQARKGTRAVESWYRSACKCAACAPQVQERRAETLIVLSRVRDTDSALGRTRRALPPTAVQMPSAGAVASACTLCEPYNQCTVM